MKKSDKKYLVIDNTDKLFYKFLTLMAHDKLYCRNDMFKILNYNTPHKIIYLLKRDTPFKEDVKNLSDEFLSEFIYQQLLLFLMDIAYVIDDDGIVPLALLSSFEYLKKHNSDIFETQISFLIYEIQKNTVFTNTNDVLTNDEHHLFAEYFKIQKT